jgi:hypothetical protein
VYGKETKDNGRLETEHQGRSEAELPETLAGMC